MSRHFFCLLVGCFFFFFGHEGCIVPACTQGILIAPCWWPKTTLDFLLLWFHPFPPNRISPDTWFRSRCHSQLVACQERTGSGLVPSFGLIVRAVRCPDWSALRHTVVSCVFVWSLTWAADHSGGRGANTFWSAALCAEAQSLSSTIANMLIGSTRCESAQPLICPLADMLLLLLLLFIHPLSGRNLKRMFTITQCFTST